MATQQTITLDQIQVFARSMSREIFESPAFLNKDLFRAMGINTITGIQFKDYKRGMERRGGTTRPYSAAAMQPTAENPLGLTSQLGKLVDVELEVKHSVNRFLDNKERYREVEGFKVNSDGTYNCPNMAQNLRQIGAEYSDDILVNILFGKYDLAGSYGVLSNYDGLFYKIAKAGLATKQVIDTDAFVPVTEDAKSANWEIVEHFIAHLPSPLQRAARSGRGGGVKIWMSPWAKAMVLSSFARTFPNAPMETIKDIDTKFLQLGNFHFIGTDLVGEGSLMVATCDGVQDWGCDSDNTEGNSKIGVAQDQFDLNNIIFQVESSNGTRLNRPGYIAVNDQANIMDPSNYIGDFMLEADIKKMKFDAANGLQVEGAEGFTKIA